MAGTTSLSDLQPTETNSSLLGVPAQIENIAIIRSYWSNSYCSVIWINASKKSQFFIWDQCNRD